MPGGRKTTTIARGKRNKARLRRLNEELSAAGLTAAGTLTKAEPARKQLRAAQREKEKKETKVKSLNLAKLERAIKNQEIQQK